MCFKSFGNHQRTFLEWRAGGPQVQTLEGVKLLLPSLALQPRQRLAPDLLGTRIRNSPGPGGPRRARDVPEGSAPVREEKIFSGAGEEPGGFQPFGSCNEKEGTEPGSIQERHCHCKHTTVSGGDSHAEETGVSGTAAELRRAEPRQLHPSPAGPSERQSRVASDSCSAPALRCGI